MAYSNKHNLFNRNQFGFHKGFSTELTLITLTNTVVEALYNRKAATTAFRDLSNVFDCVLNDVLLKKL